MFVDKKRQKGDLQLTREPVAARPFVRAFTPSESPLAQPVIVVSDETGAKTTG